MSERREETAGGQPKNEDGGVDHPRPEVVEMPKKISGTDRVITFIVRRTPP